MRIKIWKVCIMLGIGGRYLFKEELEETTIIYNFYLLVLVEVSRFQTGKQVT